MASTFWEAVVDQAVRQAAVLAPDQLKEIIVKAAAEAPAPAPEVALSNRQDGAHAPSSCAGDRGCCACGEPCILKKIVTGDANLGRHFTACATGGCESRVQFPFFAAFGCACVRACVRACSETCARFVFKLIVCVDETAIAPQGDAARSFGAKKSCRAAHRRRGLASLLRPSQCKSLPRLCTVRRPRRPRRRILRQIEGSLRGQLAFREIPSLDRHLLLPRGSIIVGAAVPRTARVSATTRTGRRTCQHTNMPVHGCAGPSRRFLVRVVAQLNLRRHARFD